jgi:hypothetical protein
MYRLVILGVAVAALAVPVSARANGIPTTGTRIALFAAPETFPADAPFYVTQGFTCEAGRTECLSGLTHFDLYVDGRLQASTTDLTFAEPGVLNSKFDLTNFWNGLGAGLHVFSGDWYYLGQLVQTQTVTIDFV